MARLLVSFQGAEFGFDLRGDGVRVGSGTANGLVLKDPSVSREHMEIRRNGPAWRLLDLESATGTRVNGLFVNRHDLKDGDVVAVGSARLTFQGDEAATPAPVPGAFRPVPVPAPLPAAPYPSYQPAPAPVPVPASAPIPAPAPAPVPVSYNYSPPAAYPPPAPVYATPPPAYRPSPPARAERGRPRPPRGPRGGGGGGGMAGIAAFSVLIIGAVVVWIVAGQGEKKADPNEALLRQAEALEARGDFEAVITLAGQADPAHHATMEKLHNAAARSRKGLEQRRALAALTEAEEYFLSRIRGPHDAGGEDAASLVLQCDDFLRRWPSHERAEEAAFIRLSLTGEPSAAWQQARGGSAPGQAGFVSTSTLLNAAEAEAGRHIEAGRYAAAYRVYGMFLERAPRTVSADSQERFRSEIAKKKKFVEDKAKKAFEGIEERAMMLEDQKRFEDASALYRDARDRLGIGEIVDRCEAELARLREKR